MAFYKGAAAEAQRAMYLQKQRDKEKQEIEQAKRKLEAEMRIGTFTNKFAVHYDAVEAKLKSETVGLITLEEMRAKQEAVVRERERQLASSKHRESQLEANVRTSRSSVNQKAVLSFDLDEEEEDNDESYSSDNVDAVKKSEKRVHDDNDDKSDSVPALCKRSKGTFGKNPEVDTSFLPDLDRELEENELREKLRLEWVAQQDKLKDEEVNIEFSFWDGSGHRRRTQMKKGNTIYQFLRKCLEILRPDFPELKMVSEDQLMYVKEDTILPHHYTFYDFIVKKVRGKSGPLYVFSVQDDVRLRIDGTVHSEETHAGKVCLRSWYERNKHIFPACRWEPFDPLKKYEKMSAADQMANTINVR